MRHSVLTIVLALPLTALAQIPPGTDIPVEGALRGRRPLPAVVHSEKVEVRAGPGAAYITRGRAYEGDPVQIRRRNEAGDWMEISVDGLRGWVRAKHLTLTKKGAKDTNRERRTTNYTYDDQGRRVRLDGSLVGSGDDTQERPDPTEEPNGNSATTWIVQVSVGGAQMERSFRSNIEQDSILETLTAQPTGLSTVLTAEWAPLRFLRVRGTFRDVRLGSVPFAAAPKLGFENAFEIAATAQQAELDVHGGTFVGPAWLGGYLGGRLFKHGFQRTAPFPIFLNTTVISAAVGGRVAGEFGRISALAEGGLLLPLSIAQDPVNSGEGSAAGAEARAEFAFRITQSLGIVVHGQWTVLNIDYKGESTHLDSPQDRGYTVAREEDTVISGGLGVRWSR